MFNMLHYSLRM